jgi:hypothetical protein
LRGDDKGACKSVVDAREDISLPDWDEGGVGGC